MSTRARKLSLSPRRNHFADHAVFNLFVSLVGSVSPTEALSVLLQPRATAAAARKPKNAHESRRARFTFTYLLSMHYIECEQQGASLVIRLTDKGKRRAMMAHLDDMMLQLHKARPTIWDGTWRLILFDIPAHERAKRNAFRTLIRRLGAVILQKSVWAYPYDCKKEMNQLGEFFGLSQDQLRIVLATDIEGDEALLKHFKLQQRK